MVIEVSSLHETKYVQNPSKVIDLSFSSLLPLSSQRAFDRTFTFLHADPIHSCLASNKHQRSGIMMSVVNIQACSSLQLSQDVFLNPHRGTQSHIGTNPSYDQYPMEMLETTCFKTLLYAFGTDVPETMLHSWPRELEGRPRDGRECEPSSQLVPADMRHCHHLSGR